MHHALHIPEVVAFVILHVKSRRRRRQGDSNLAALARTCHAFSDPALDALWEEPPLWHLARTMSERLWTTDISCYVLNVQPLYVDVAPLHTLVSTRAGHLCT
jgi:hypothetical protein